MNQRLQSVIDSHVMLGAETHLTLEATELLERMDHHEVKISIARNLGSELVVENTRGNDRLLKAGPRIKALISVNPWYGSKAIDELQRCHDLGAVGLFLHPARQGFFPSEPIAAPLIRAAVHLGWPIMFHTGTFIYSEILSVAEVARRYPEASFIAGFGGFSDMWFELPHIFSEVENLYLDTSLIWGDAIAQIVAEVGSERVLFASAEPRNRYTVAFKRLERLQFDQDQLLQILSANARRIFRIE